MRDLTRTQKEQVVSLSRRSISYWQPTKYSGKGLILVSALELAKKKYQFNTPWTVAYIGTQENVSWLQSTLVRYNSELSIDYYIHHPTDKSYNSPRTIEGLTLNELDSAPNILIVETPQCTQYEIHSMHPIRASALQVICFKGSVIYII